LLIFLSDNLEREPNFDRYNWPLTTLYY